jgi:hypothetical protein
MVISVSVVSTMIVVICGTDIVEDNVFLNTMKKYKISFYRRNASLKQIKGKRKSGSFERLWY